MAMELRNTPAKFTHADHRLFKRADKPKPLEAVRVVNTFGMLASRKPKEGQRGRLRQIRKAK